jgi:ferredoxin--NADP+ reductase
MENHYQVAVVGAGPAGLFGARELASLGAHVVVFNRDIKPGGLAEYGVYPSKHIMKEGFRKQFRQALAAPNVEYYGNVVIGKGGDLQLEDLRRLGFQAILVSVGAQGTKWLGLPGENLEGVYHAKDVVYFYNQLPPFSHRQFRFGKRCVIVGAGNVMVDVAHFLIRDRKVEEVVAVVRRGPLEVNFTNKEMEAVIANLDVERLDAEIQRVAPMMTAIGQDPEAGRAKILAALHKAVPANSQTRFRFEFLTSPVQMHGVDGSLAQLEVEDNVLALKDGETKARGTGKRRMLQAETVVFAIGDKVDEAFGLPVESSEFVKNPTPRFPVENLSYEAFDPKSGEPIDGVFVGGWSRKASEGLVGYARKDGINAAKAVWQYLQTLAPASRGTEGLAGKLRDLNKPVVTKADIEKLEAVEAAEAQRRGLEEFRFGSNEEMLQAMTLLQTV